MNDLASEWPELVEKLAWVLSKQLREGGCWYVDRVVNREDGRMAGRSGCIIRRSKMTCSEG